MFFFDGRIELVMCALLCGAVLVALSLKQRMKKVWESPESEICAIWIPTDDPINDRCEFFVAKNPSHDVDGLHLQCSRF